MHHVAIYDLDKTLTRRATYTPFLIFAARSVAPWRLVLLPFWIAALLGYKAGFYGRGTLKAFGLRLMVGSALQEQLRAVGARFAERHLAGSGALPAVATLLQADRSAGHTVALATAAFEFYAVSFAAHFGIEHVIATGWDERAGRIDNCYGDEKHRRVLAWLAEQGLRRDAIRLRFVSDSFADAPLLNLADEAIFVTRSDAKRRRAQACGWRTISGD